MTTTDNPRQRRNRHVARSARILSTGLSATAILGITAAFGVAERIDTGSQDAEPSGPLAAMSATSATVPVVDPGFVDSTPVAQFPSPEGTVTLPTGSPAPANTTQQVRVATAASPLAPTTAQATVDPVPLETMPVATVAPIAPAEPPVELTLPPAPSNGSSGGSR